MKGLFSGESGIGKALTKIGELVVLSILWFFTSLPVVTIGVSTTALYYAMVKSVRMDRGYFFKEYFKAWKDNFLRSTGIMIFFFIFLLFPSQNGNRQKRKNRQNAFQQYRITIFRCLFPFCRHS